MMLVEARALEKAYEADPGVPALRGVSFGIAPGEFLAIVGPSGSGKTTLLNLLATLDRPSSGEVLFKGVSLAEPAVDLADWRNRHAGIVFQDHLLLSDLSLLRNVMLPMRIGRRVRPAAAAERAFHLLEQVGLGHLARRRPAQVSGGQRQRVAIARALANEPELLLTDEPTGNLDRNTARAIYDVLEGLTERLGVTLVMVTHDPEAAARAHRIVTLVDGRVISDDRRR